jgi:hypothetical protein
MGRLGKARVNRCLFLVVACREFFAKSSKNLRFTLYHEYGVRKHIRLPKSFTSIWVYLFVCFCLFIPNLN